MAADVRKGKDILFITHASHEKAWSQGKSIPRSSLKNQVGHPEGTYCFKKSGVTVPTPTRGRAWESRPDGDDSPWEPTTGRSITLMKRVFLPVRLVSVGGGRKSPDWRRNEFGRWMEGFPYKKAQS